MSSARSASTTADTSTIRPLAEMSARTKLPSEGYDSTPSIFCIAGVQPIGLRADELASPTRALPARQAPAGSPRGAIRLMLNGIRTRMDDVDQFGVADQVADPQRRQPERPSTWSARHDEVRVVGRRGARTIRRGRTPGTPGRPRPGIPGVEQPHPARSLRQPLPVGLLGLHRKMIFVRGR